MSHYVGVKIGDKLNIVVIYTAIYTADIVRQLTLLADQIYFLKYFKNKTVTVLVYLPSVQ